MLRSRLGGLPWQAVGVAIMIVMASPSLALTPEEEVGRAIAIGLEAFEAKNLPRLMSLVSDSYRSGPMTKEAIRLQLLAIFQTNSELKVSLKIHDIRVRGTLAYVRSSGQVSGLPLFWPHRVVILEWTDLVEVGRREGDAWRLYGAQR